MSKTYSAGIVTAYGAAKRAGYQGTYEDFCRQQAGYAENAAAVEQAKTTAVNAASTATAKAGEATTAATAARTAKTQTEAAASQALTDISTTRSGAISAVQTEGQTQTANARAQAQAAAQSATTANTKASEASASATSAGQSATNAATSATSAANSASAAQAVLNSIPEDYSDLSEDVGQLKADLGAVKLIANPMAVDALLACFRDVAWINNQGQECYYNLVKAINGLSPVYAISGGTDISTSPINTGISVFGKNEDFTILAKLRLKVWPTERTMGLLVNDRYVSNGTLRLGTEYENGKLRFVTNVMYGDLTTGYVIPANISHDIKWVVRVKDKIATKILYIDNQQYVNKVEDITSYMDARTFEGNYYVSGINLNSNQNTYPAVIDLFRIYDCALDDSYIESVMDINV